MKRMKDDITKGIIQEATLKTFYQDDPVKKEGHREFVEGSSRDGQVKSEVKRKEVKHEGGPSTCEIIDLSSG
ncbi:hypothetical protein SCHPADRAFT_940176 [Schizopora paradoxa]|uniref:Uncharacterized protein n=1 Tax=Schizopora paradoxa TaxID=27342 RepID=A0A0H2S9S6_9AGAM|nr:hypothetical protein SCHPADRAFT_940176 [Schizopora paradoxa]